MILPFCLYVKGQTPEQLKQFKRGVELMKSKHYNEAIAIFESLKPIKSLTADCEERIKEAQRQLVYITIKTDNNIMGIDDPLVIDCQKCDTFLTVSSNHRWRIDNYTTGIREVKIKGDKLFLSLLDKNKSIEDKKEYVKISAGQAPNKSERIIEVIHLKHPPYLKCSTENVNSRAEGDHESITVDTNIEWEVECNNDWCSIARDSNIIKINVKENDKVIERSAQLIIKSKSNINNELAIKVIITQKSGIEELFLSKSDLNISADGGNEYVRVFSNDAWQVKDHPSWCRVERIIGTDSIRIECTENVTGIVRDEYAKITTRTGNKVASIRIIQPSNEFVPKYAFDKILEGRNVAFGVHAGGIYPLLLTSSSGNFTGSMINYGLGTNLENASYKMKLGFTMGIIADIRLYKNLYLKTGLDYSHISYTNDFQGDVNIVSIKEPNVSYVKGLSQNSYKETYKFHFIDIPIIASYRFLLDKNSCIHLDLGTYINYGLSATMNLSGTTDANNLYKYKIINGVYTSEKVSNATYETHFRKSATINLYKRDAEMKEIYTSGADNIVNQPVVLDDAPFKRLNFGIMLGAAYEYAGFCIGLNYKQGLSNMANNKFWESERLHLLNSATMEPLNMAGYKQRMGHISLDLSYIFRYKKK